MKEYRYKYNIEFENFILNRDLCLLLEIYDNIYELGLTKSKELSSEINKITKRIIKESNSSTLNDQEQKIHEDFVNYAFHYNFLTLHSLFVSAMSLFENYLMSVAKSLENNSNSFIKIKDMSRDKSDLDRIRKYLNLVHTLETAKSENNEWQKIIKFQKIRNLIVHNNNKFKNDNSKESLITFLKTYDAHLPRRYKFEIRDRKFFADFNIIATTYSNNLVNEIYKI